MGNCFTRGLRYIERHDRVALLRLTIPPTEAAALGTEIEAAFPERLSFTLSPVGEALVVLTEDALDASNPRMSAARISRGLSAIRVSGVCMSGAENKARQICAALARAGIVPRSVSLCDLGLALTVPTPDADRTVELIGETVPLLW